jgi:hypothetical protein
VVGAINRAATVQIIRYMAISPVSIAHQTHVRLKD